MTSVIETRFQDGDLVKVSNLNKLGHVRIPFYVREKFGTVVQHCGKYLNPEDLAVGRTCGPAVDLYRVAFEQSKLWPKDKHSAGDTLVIEVYDHLLEPL